MASVMNSFDLLKGAESTLNSKKKKNKNKGGKGEENGAAGPASSAENGASSSSSAKGGAVVDVSEAIAAVERSAREAKSVADKCKLWKEWIRQASDRSAKAPKYKDVDGTTVVDFRQVVLRSRALESSVESAVSGAHGTFTSDAEDLLAQLLLAFSTRFDPSSAQRFASAIARLSHLAEQDAVDVQSASQRAVHAVLAAVKAGAADAGAGADSAAASLTTWMDKVSGLGQTIGREQGALAKLAAAGRGNASKEHAEIARKIFRLTGEQLSLLQPDNLPPGLTGEGGAGGAGESSYAPHLDALRHAISSRIQAEESTKPAQKGKGGGGGAAADRQSALVALKREEAALAQQGDTLAQQIRTLEAQLRSLRSQQQDVEDRRTQLQQRMRVAEDPSRQGKKGSLGVAHHQEELAVLDSIGALLRATGGGAGGADQEQLVAVQATAQSVASDYLTAARQFLGLAKSVMQEVPGKVQFCQQRQKQAEKLQKLGAKDNTKISDDAEKLMADTLRSADELLRASVQAASELALKHEALSRAMPGHEQAIIDALRASEAQLVEIRAHYDVVQALVRPPVVPAPPPPAPAAAAVAPPPPPQPVVPVAAAAAAPVANGGGAARQVGGAAVAVVQPAVAPAPAPAEAAPAKAPSAFDAAAAYLAKSRPISAPIRSESPGTRKPAPPVAVAAKPVAAPAPPSAGQVRQWNKPASEAAASASADDALPTPAEAFKVPGPPAAAPAAAAGDDEFKTGKRKGGRPKV